MQTATDVQDRSLSITRTFNAPCALVFACWTDPQHLANWSGPEGFTATSDYFNASPGGRYRSCLTAPDGTEHWVQGTYLEVIPPHRLVFTHAWEDEVGQPGLETVVTIDLTPRGDRTEMRFHQAVFVTRQSRDGHHGGWSSSFDVLDRYLGDLA